MNNKTKLVGISLLVVLAVLALGAGIAFAQDPTPDPDYGPGWMRGGRAGMMGGYAQDGDGWEWMDAMHQWMTASGGMHTFVWDALAENLGLSIDELYAEVNSGKTVAQVAEEKGLSRADLVAALESAHEDGLAQAVTDGVLTQDQAEELLAQMAGRYEWMLDHMGAGYGMMGRYFGQGDADGSFFPGGCHRNWDGDTPSQQPRP